jgi:hypothetical protein
MSSFQTNNNILGQSSKNPNAMKVFNKPDTDARLISITGDSSTIEPNLMFDHAIIVYTSPIGNVTPVSFLKPNAKYENRTLLSLTLNNTQNTGSKTFVFSPEYKFLDDVGVNTYTIPAGKSAVWYGAIINNRIYLRVQSDSTI